MVTGLQKKTESFVYPRYADARNSTAFTVKMSEMEISRNFG